MKHLGITFALLLTSSIAGATPKDRVDSTARIYPAVLADWEAGDGKSTIADVHAWSVQWLEAQLALPVHPRAFADHLARMMEVEAAAQRDSAAGLIGSTLALDEATFYRAEAERWQAHRRIL